MKHQLINNFEKHSYFIWTLCFVIILIIYRNTLGIVQQDNYIEYAQGLSKGFENISYYDSRLYAGFPILIIIFKQFIFSWQLSGYFVVITSFVGCYIILYKITRSKYSFLPLIFPPVLLDQATKISTEFPTLFLLLLSIYLIRSKNTKLAMLSFGSSVWIRHNILVASIPPIWKSVKKHGIKNIFVNSLAFTLPLALYGVFNIYYLGTNNPLYPYTTYLDIGGRRFGLGPVQLYKDVIRAYSWGQFRILSSGLLYLLLLLFSFIYTYFYMKMKVDNFSKIVFNMALFIGLFAMLIGYEPFLELYPRYLTGVFPLLWIITYRKLESFKISLLLLALSIFAVAV